jgi:hypothetical protein
MLDERQILFCELLVLTGCRAVDGFVQEVNALNSYCAGPPLRARSGMASSSHVGPFGADARSKFPLALIQFCDCVRTVPVTRTLLSGYRLAGQAIA